MTASLLLSFIVCIGFLAQWIAWRSRLPAILFLLISGVVLGPVTGILQPDALFGDLLFPFVSLAVAIILFEGALTLKFDEVKTLSLAVQRLLTVGTLITWACVTTITHFLFQIDLSIAVLFGAIMVVTGPTVITPMIRTVRPNANISKVLRWEGIVIDPIGAILAVLVFEFLVRAKSGNAIGLTIQLFFQVLAVGFAFGAASGWLLGHLLKRFWVPEYLQTMATLTFVFVAYSSSNAIAHESGLLTVTVMGMWLANTKGVHLEEILYFKENLSVVLISGLFVLLAARIDPMDFAHLGLLALLLFLGVQFIARPLSVFIATFKTELTLRERALLAWIAPRGIVAAAVSALFALKLEEENIKGAELLVPLCFTVIIGTVLFQSITSKWVAKWLQVSAPAPTGIIIIGANPVAQAVGKTLKELEFEVLVCDSNWAHVKSARMAGLNAFYGNPVSEYAQQKLDLTGFGKVLALSPYHELNVIASVHFRSELGKKNIYTLLADSETLRSDKHRTSADHQGQILFNKYLTYSKLSMLLRDGAEIKKTKLSDEFTFEDYLAHHENQLIPLFAITSKERLVVFKDGATLKPEAGWNILSLSYGENENTPNS